MDDDTERVAKNLERLYEAGGLSDESAGALEAVSPQHTASGLGERSSSSELLLVSVLVDDSTSIATSIDEIRLGHGKLLKALRSKPFTADVQVHSRAMNLGVIRPYEDLAHAAPLTETNYSGSRLVPETPLYLQSLLMLRTVMVKAQEEEDHGVTVRTFTLIITDGEDNGSGKITARHVRAVVTDMLEFATNHIVAGMGVGERDGIDFRDVFRGMGISRILTPGTSVKELEDAFDAIAETLCIAASSEAGFAQLAAESSG